MPALIAAAVAGALSAFVMRFVVLRDDPEGVLERGRRTLLARVHGLLHAVRDVAEHPDSAQRRRELHNRSVRLNETSLMLENTVGQLDTLDEAGRELLRQRILDVELAAENLLTPLMRLVDHPSGGDTVPHAIGALLAVLRTEPEEIREATRLVAERIEQQGSVEVAWRCGGSAPGSRNWPTRPVNSAGSARSRKHRNRPRKRNHPTTARPGCSGRSCGWRSR
ncbi:hypothetical protein [Saccharopolyspora sp. ASAGF58]|uniref:hypothetical protein n=1 Tax=Saccharopolyspora sp. ASAGF58 TaxID=2719023 RepID=UPI001FF099F1|nr:hypothetical protein [Saccharopolyspora sp. ASAGF58]